MADGSCLVDGIGHLVGRLDSLGTLVGRLGQVGICTIGITDVGRGRVCGRDTCCVVGTTDRTVYVVRGDRDGVICGTLRSVLGTPYIGGSLAGRIDVGRRGVCGRAHGGVVRTSGGLVQTIHV